MSISKKLAGAAPESRRRGRVAAAVTLVVALLAPAGALAKTTTETAQAGGTSATVSYQGTSPQISHLTLSISNQGQVLYTQPVNAVMCGTRCEPGSFGTGKSSVQVLDLESNGTEDVVLNLYSGGAHCCSIVQIFSLDPGTETYTRVQRNFYDPGYRITDLGHTGHYEFVSADDAFAYEFTDFAASGLPIQIFSYAAGRFSNVTRSYPKQVASDAALWKKAFKSAIREHDTDGLIAAWAADEDLLGHSSQVNTYLNQQAAAGHLRSALNPHLTAHKFISELKRFLRRQGYLR